jgi:methyltransferase (TIGR00027 family)
MRKNQSSLTAVGIAIVRGIESEKPEDKRICYDPYAKQFVQPFLYKFVRFFDRIGYSEIKGPGVMGFLTVRERHIDEHLKACLADGLEQLVILGAGYDARAYRFDELKNGVRVFEVDHPASQADKLSKLKQVFGSQPGHVMYVPVDFNTQSLDQRLAEFGYDESLKTLFIWQGVTQYLTPQAVDETLAFIAEHSGPGSSVIFDYMYPTLLNGTIKRGEVSNMRNKGWVSGEMMVFGIPEGQITEFLEQRGFTNVLDADHKYLHDTYFTGENANRTVAYGYAIASAVVGPSS